MIVSVQPHFHIQQHELLTPETLNPTESLKYHYSAVPATHSLTVISLVMSQHGIWKSQECIMQGGSGAHMDATGDVRCDVVIFSLYIYGNRMQTVCESLNE